MREASVTMVEKVAEFGDESNSPLVMMSTNSILTAVVSVLLAMLFLEDDFRKVIICIDRKGVFLVRDWWTFLSCLYMSQVACFGFLLVFIVQ